MPQKDIIYKIKIDGSQAKRSVKEVSKEIDALEKEFKEATVGTERYIQAQRRLNSLNSALKKSGIEYRNSLRRTNELQQKTAASTNQAAGGFGSLGNAMNLAKGAAVALIALDLAGRIKDLAVQGLTAAGAYENLQISFETFLGSASKADQVLASLNKFSVETPFTPEDVQAAARAFIAIGTPISETNKLLRDLGNISAGVNTNFVELATLLAKAKAQGRLFQEDINQLTGRGIPIYEELAKVIGTTEAGIRKQVEAGKVGFPQIQKAISNLTKEGAQFGGLIERQSKTLPGLISTLEGSWNNLLRTFAQSELLEPAKASIAALIDLVGGLGDTIDPNAKKIADGVAEIKKELSLDGLSELTKNELDQRSEQFNQALFEEERTLTFFLAKQKKAEQDLTNFKINEFSARTEFDKKEQLKADLESANILTETQKQRVAAIKIGIDDISKIEKAEAKIVKARIDNEKADRLKLQIFRAELALQTIRGLSTAEAGLGELQVDTINKVAVAEIKLSKLRERLSNLNAKNNSARTLNAEKEEQALRIAGNETRKTEADNLEVLTDEFNKTRAEANKLVSEFIEISVLTEATQEGAAAMKITQTEIDKTTGKSERLALALDNIFGEGGTFETIESFAPLVFDAINQAFDEQIEKLDSLVDLQKKRVEDAQKIAENGNAEALKQERERLAKIEQARETASRRSQQLALIETRIQIALAVAKTAAAAAGTTLGIGTLAAGAAVAIGLPAIINSIPVFEKGGFIGGEPHSRGGTMIEAEKGEFITNKASSSIYSPALKAINNRTADPSLVNAIATGNVNNVINMQTKPLEQRLASIEAAIIGKPESSFLIDEKGFMKRTSTIQAKANRINQIIG